MRDHADCRDERVGELIVREAREQARLADARVADKDQFEGVLAAHADVRSKRAGNDTRTRPDIAMRQGGSHGNGGTC